METTNSERIILAVKLRANHNNPGLGLIQPVAELSGGQLVKLTPDNFCPSGAVFINSRYEDIDGKYSNGELFRIAVSPNPHISDKANNPSTYLAQGSRAEKLQQSELAEIIESDLPDRNDRKLYGIPLPATPYIFVWDSSGDCFGPFAWEPDNTDDEQQTGIILKFITGGGLGRAGSTKQIHRIEKLFVDNRIVSCQIGNRNHFFVPNVAAMVSGASDLEDYTSDTEIIEYVQKMAAEVGYRSVEKKVFQQLSSLISKNPKNNNQLVRNRLARFANLSTDGLEIQSAIQDGLNAYLESEFGRNALEGYVQENRSRYLDQLKKDREFELDETLSRKREEIRQADDRQKQMREDLARIIDDIERKRKEADQELILAGASAAIEAQLSDKRKQLSAVEEELKALSKQHGDYERIEQIEEKIKEREAVRRHVDQMVAEVSKTYEGLRKEAEKKDDELRSRLMDLSPYINAINGSGITGNIELPSVSIRTSEMDWTGDISEQQRTVIEAIQQKLNKSGRSMDAWQVANLLICTQQSFITFMAGLPGVGKTSLSRLLAEVQGLAPRLHEVSVARGWTSLKDIVGFHNPLANRFQPASTGLYQYLEALTDELKVEKAPAMSYVLLDEANLSPIEHYWSSFMSMSDVSGDMPLRLGQKTLQVPRHLRFLATINYDGTTEPLSPRVVDRAPVLVMEPNSIGDAGVSSNHSGLELPLSAKQMESLFGLAPETPSFQDEEASAFDEIREVLAKVADRGRPISISQRKIVAIRQYCGRARSIMSPDGDTLALDLAVLQHVLPQARGHGSKFGDRLKELKKALDGYQLVRSSAYLQRMIAYGESDLHSYDFFCW